MWVYRGDSWLSLLSPESSMVLAPLGFLLSLWTCFSFPLNTVFHLPTLSLSIISKSWFLVSPTFLSPSTHNNLFFDPPLSWKWISEIISNYQFQKRQSVFIYMMYLSTFILLITPSSLKLLFPFLVLLAYDPSSSISFPGIPRTLARVHFLFSMFCRVIRSTPVTSIFPYIPWPPKEYS